MGDRSAEMINIMIAVIAVVALMALGFAIFTISKRMANNAQNDLVNQLGQINNSLYTDLDQAVITGARLKGVVQQATTADCAIVVSTLGFLGAQTEIGDGGALGEIKNYSTGTKVGVTSGESSLNGNVEIQMRSNATDSGAKVPVVQLEDMPLQTAMGTQISYPLAVNFGSILKNAILEPGSGDHPWGIDGSQYTSNFSVTNGTKGMALVTPAAYTDASSPEYNQRILYKDGQFNTKLEYATNLVNSKVLRYDMISDFTKTGKTFSIPDTAQFNSYVLKNASGEYLGLVFIQLKK